MILWLRLSVGLLLVGAVLPLHASAELIDLNTLDWAVKSLIDTSREPFPEPTYGPQPPANTPTPAPVIPGGSTFDLPGQHFTPRNARGIAVSPDGRYMYVGYAESRVFNDNSQPVQNRQGEVRRIDLYDNNVTSASTNTPTLFDTQWEARLIGNRGKALAVDYKGRVYMAETNRIDIYNADLSVKLMTLNTSNNEVGGLDVTLENGNLMLYYSLRNGGTLVKTQISEGVGDAVVTNTNVWTRAMSGELKGVEVDADAYGNNGSGQVWVAGWGANTLYRVDADNTNFTSRTLTRGDPINADMLNTQYTPSDIAFNGDQVFVTLGIKSTPGWPSNAAHLDPSLLGTDRLVRTFDKSAYDANAINALTGVGVDTWEPDWAALGLDPDGDNFAGHGQLSGIVAVLTGPTNGLYIVNETGQTREEGSTYGAFDDRNGNGLQDDIEDDNEPVLYAPFFVIPEPGSLALGFMALTAFLWQSRRRR